jgi:hypothetical protein
MNTFEGRNLHQGKLGAQFGLARSCSRVRGGMCCGGLAGTAAVVACSLQPSVMPLCSFSPFRSRGSAHLHISSHLSSSHLMSGRGGADACSRVLTADVVPGAFCRQSTGDKAAWNHQCPAAAVSSVCVYSAFGQHGKVDRRRSHRCHLLCR